METPSCPWLICGSELQREAEEPREFIGEAEMLPGAGGSAKVSCGLKMCSVQCKAPTRS